MSDVVVYGMAYSNFVRTVRMVLIEKGVAHTLEPVGFDSPEIKAMHPFRKVPAFRHGELTLFESQAICRYIDDAFDGPSLRPGSLAEKAVVDQWVAASCDYADKAFIRHYVLSYAIPKWQGQEPDPEKIAAAVPGVGKVLRILDRQMEGRAYLAADRLTLADLFLAPMVFLLTLYPESREMLAASPNLLRWLDTMKALESFQATKPPKG